MDGFRGEGMGMRGIPYSGFDLKGPGSTHSDNTRFDASQYDFFGRDAVEEVELGGLEGDGDEDAGFLRTYRDEVEGLGVLSDIDDLTSVFSKLNKNVTGPRNAGVIGDRRSFSRESSSTADWSQDADFTDWLDQTSFDPENAQDEKRWWSQPQSSSAPVGEPKPLYRTSTYPQQQPPHDPVGPLLTAPPSSSSFTSYPPPGSRSKVPPLLRHSSVPLPLQAPASQPLPFSPQSSSSSFSGSQLRLGGGLPYGGSMPQFTPGGGLSIYGRQPSMVHHPSMVDLLRQQWMLGALQPRVSPPHLQSFLSHSFISPPQAAVATSKLELVAAMAEQREPRSRGAQRGRQGSRAPLSGGGSGGSGGSQKGDAAVRLQFRSKYMSAEEIENILRIQHAAGHNSDPYVDDYYHQACTAKRSAMAARGRKHQFWPATLHDGPHRGRNGHEAHSFIQVDALGRLSFSSIRRPRPLLEADPPAISGDRKVAKPLEQEPLLAARIAIEDGLCLLLDVDDIDRLLHSGQHQESSGSGGTAQLRRRRQVLLEGLGASLQLVDPLGHSAGLSPNDDLVFLRLASLPKGRKLIARYLQLLFPGSEIARMVCMAVFRHLRILFGGLPADPAAAETTAALARAVSSCVDSMDLSALSACLAAIVCSSEQPPLRPIGSSAGDGASVIIKAILERATHLLTGPQAAAGYSLQIRSLWQASFNAFFTLLTKYCLRKYDAIVQSLLLQAPTAAAANAEVARAVGREMPVELLRASLPHTDEHQHLLLLEFARRSTMPVAGFNAGGGGGGGGGGDPLSSEFVPG